jgi:multiple sugar transport system permease protein
VSRIKRNYKYILLIIIVVIVLFPIIWILLQSFKSYFDIIAIPPKFIFKPTLQNYFSVIQTTGFIKYFKESLIVALSSLMLCIIVGTPFGYILARYNKLPGIEQLGFFILSTRMMPPIVVIVPLIRIFNFLNLIDTYIGIILTHILINLALIVWVTRSFFAAVPVEIEEAAWVDGSSYIGTFIKIVFPLAAPGVAATAILALLFSWNDLIFALTFANFNVKTLPVFVATEFVGYLAVNWGGLSAAGVIVIIPTVIFIVVIRRRMVSGLTFGAIQ